MKPSRLQKHLKTQNDDDQMGVSTEDIDVITENTKSPGRRRTENRSSLPPPPFLTEIRKMHYVLFINIYI